MIFDCVEETRINFVALLIMSSSYNSAAGHHLGNVTNIWTRLIEVDHHEIDPADVAAAPYIQSVTERFSELRSALEKNESVKVTIAADEGSKTTNIGTGLAENQWKKLKLPPHVSKQAYGKFMMHLQSVCTKLAEDYPDRVSFGKLVRSNASKTHYLVWGANAANVTGKDNAKIIGSGQASAMATYGPGVFGIVSTPLAGPPKLKCEIPSEEEWRENVKANLHRTLIGTLDNYVDVELYHKNAAHTYKPIPDDAVLKKKIAVLRDNMKDEDLVMLSVKLKQKDGSQVQKHYWNVTTDFLDPKGKLGETFKTFGLPDISKHSGFHSELELPGTKAYLLNLSLDEARISELQQNVREREFFTSHLGDHLQILRSALGKKEGQPLVEYDVDVQKVSDITNDKEFNDIAHLFVPLTSKTYVSFLGNKRNL